MPSISKIYLYENFTVQKDLEIKQKTKKAIKRLKKKKINYKGSNYKKFRNTRDILFRRTFVKKWFISFVSVIAKKGISIKYQNYVLLIFQKLNLKYNLFKFFYKLEQNLFIAFETFKKKIAGKNFLIPLGLDLYKRINSMTKLIISSLKFRKEKKFIDKFYNELIDVFNNKGLSITKRLQYTKQLKEILTNIRFLNEKYI